MAAFVSDSAANDETRDAIIAHLAKAAWDRAQSLGRYGVGGGLGSRLEQRGLLTLVFLLFHCTWPITGRRTLLGFLVALFLFGW